jgi:hypothetical protein
VRRGTEATDQLTADMAGAADRSGEGVVKIPIPAPEALAEECELDEARIRRLASEAPRVIRRLSPGASAPQEASELVKVLALPKQTSMPHGRGCDAQQLGVIE